jgi:DNA polymerase elongation subunit (family B)
LEIAPTEPAMPALPVSEDTLLYGHDPTERLVGIHPEGPAAVRLYTRHPDGRVTSATAPVHPFLFLTDARLLDGLPRVRTQRLDGDNAYRHVAVFPDRGAQFDALRHIERATGTEASRPADVYTVGGPEQQYLMQTGRTLFKGMAFEDLRRLQLDIEVVAHSGFPQAEVPEHRVVLVALSDSTGWQHLVGSPDMDEETVLRETVRIVTERDPDVIEGHNLYAFDLPYLAARCKRHRVPFALGRDGSEPRTFPSSIRFAERQIEYDAAEIAGRHVVDTMFLAMSYDVFARSLPNYTLKGVAKHFGFAPEGRTYVPGDEIASVWESDPARIMDYALDDVNETERIARHLSGSTFYLTQMVPMPYGMVARTGPAAKIEALFVRAYLHARHSLPRAQWGSQHVGGYTDVFVTGVVGPVVYADVESLYPSVMLTSGVQPASDALGLFPRLLRTLTDLRFETKAAARAATTLAERSELDARQTAYKNIINSFYGSLGFQFALFNDFAEADRVATEGQAILRRIMADVRTAGGRVIEVDTDGVLFVPPPHVRGEEQERAFVAALSEDMPAGIRIGFDGRYRAMLSYKKKNYALLGHDGELAFKGSSLVSRSTERFGRAFVREATRLLLDVEARGAEAIADLHRLYLDTRARIASHDWQGVESFQRVETLKMPLDDYEREVADGKTRSAAYEVARKEAARTGRPVRRGERVAFYIAEARPGEVPSGTRVFELARPASGWDPAAPDESTAFYLDRLDRLALRFEPFFETPAQHRLVFSPEDLFGFDPAGVRLVVQERAPETVEDDVPF